MQGRLPVRVLSHGGGAPGVNGASEGPDDVLGRRAQRSANTIWVTTTAVRTAHSPCKGMGKSWASAKANTAETVIRERVHATELRECRA